MKRDTTAMTSQGLQVRIDKNMQKERGVFGINPGLEKREDERRNWKVLKKDELFRKTSVPNPCRAEAT